MRVELDIGDGAGTALGEGLPPFRPARRRRTLDGFELAMLGVFGLLSLWVIAVDLWQVIAHHRVWTGTDGVYIVDQMQYLAWIRDASRHFLTSNLFVVQPTTADYFQPAVTISAGLTALRVSPCGRMRPPASPGRERDGLRSCSGCSSGPSASSTARSASWATCSSASCRGGTPSGCSPSPCSCSPCWPTTAPDALDSGRGWPGSSARRPRCFTPGRRR